MTDTINHLISALAAITAVIAAAAAIISVMFSRLSRRASRLECSPSVWRGRVAFVAPEYRDSKRTRQQMRRLLSPGEPLAFQNPPQKLEKKVN